MHDPENPVIVSTLDLQGDAYDVSTVEIRDKIYALVADRSLGLKIIEINDPKNP